MPVKRSPLNSVTIRIAKQNPTIIPSFANNGGKHRKVKGFAGIDDHSFAVKEGIVLQYPDSNGLRLF
jgi:hypothetical protein